MELGLDSEVTFGVLGSICEPGPMVRIVFSLNKREHLRVLVVEESTPCATAGVPLTFPPQSDPPLSSTTRPEY